MFLYTSHASVSSIFSTFSPSSSATYQCKCLYKLSFSLSLLPTAISFPSQIPFKPIPCLSWTSTTFILSCSREQLFHAVSGLFSYSSPRSYCIELLPYCLSPVSPTPFFQQGKQLSSTEIQAMRTSVYPAFSLFLSGNFFLNFWASYFKPNAIMKQNC